MAHKSKIIQTLSSSNFRYIIKFFIVYIYWTFFFYTELTCLAQKLKYLDGTCGAKLDYSN